MWTAGASSRGASMAAPILALLLALGGAIAAQDALPQLTAPVNDLARVVDPTSAAELDRIIRRLEQATGDTVVVTTVPTFAPYGDIREMAVKMFENRGRGIGEKGKDNGMLVLVAVNDRKVWVEVGYGLEGIITDGFAGEVSRQYMAPAFREGAYGRGLVAGVTRIIGRIGEARGVSVDDLPRVRSDREVEHEGIPIGLLLLLLLVLFIVLANASAQSRASRPRRRDRYWGGGPWSGWGGGWGGFGGGTGGFGGGNFGGGFGGFGGGRSGGGGGGASW